MPTLTTSPVPRRRALGGVDSIVDVDEVGLATVAGQASRPPLAAASSNLATAPPRLPRRTPSSPPTSELDAVHSRYTIRGRRRLATTRAIGVIAPSLNGRLRSEGFRTAPLPVHHDDFLDGRRSSASARENRRERAPADPPRPRPGRAERVHDVSGRCSLISVARSGGTASTVWMCSSTPVRRRRRVGEVGEPDDRSSATRPPRPHRRGGRRGGIR